MHHFCTYFDRNYLLRGLTLYRSLLATGIEFRFYVLCLDNETYQHLEVLALSNIRAINIAEVEAWDSDLIAAKSNRSLIEYYFTLSPVLPLYIFEYWSEVEIITYMDADLFFYASPAPLFVELGDLSILITEHRFPMHLKEKEVYGRFNVQYQSFRRDAQGLVCLRRWREQCVDWCYDRLEGNRYADQKYLEEWPSLYDRLVISRCKGAGVAPWNWATYPLSLKDNCLYVNEEAIIFYHFHGLKILRPYLISHGLADFGLMQRKFRQWLYGGYVQRLKDTARWIEEMGVEPPSLCHRQLRGPSLKSISTLREILQKVWVQLMWV